MHQHRLKGLIVLSAELFSCICVREPAAEISNFVHSCIHLMYSPALKPDVAQWTMRAKAWVVHFVIGDDTPSLVKDILPGCQRPDHAQ